MEDVSQAPDQAQQTIVRARTGEVQIRFSRLHIPSGTVTAGEHVFLDAFDALRELSRWNRQQPDTWRYWV